LSDGVTWKNVFDVGFRPTHVRDGHGKCRQLGVNLGVRLYKNGETLHLGRGDIEFSLRAEHEVSLISFYGREKRMAQFGEKQLEKFAQIFEMPEARLSFLKIKIDGHGFRWHLEYP
jgi:hypothetical protein